MLSRRIPEAQAEHGAASEECLQLRTGHAWGVSLHAARTYHDLLEYLQQLDDRIQRVDLEFEGKCHLA